MTEYGLPLCEAILWERNYEIGFKHYRHCHWRRVRCPSAVAMSIVRLLTTVF